MRRSFDLTGGFRFVSFSASASSSPSGVAVGNKDSIQSD